MRRPKDRDFLRTTEDFLFCVVGYAHPRDRVISYLKYVPSGEGKWGSGGERYARTMPNYTIPSLLSNIKMLREKYPRYVFRSRVFSIEMSAVPHSNIAECYFPEVKLQALLDADKLDSLQEEVVELVSFLSRETGVSKDCFGVTGSILTDIHNPRFSDIDLTVYGKANAWKVKEALKEIGDDEDEEGKDALLRRPSREEQFKTWERWVRDYPFTLSEAEALYKRRWNYLRFRERMFSIHAIRKEDEIAEKYGEKRYFPRGIVEGNAKIVGVEESLFLPCTYKVEDFKTETEWVGKVGEIVSYDGIYAGMFEQGENISVRGKLELVTDKRGNSHMRILVGSPEARGRDYIKP